MQRTTYGGKMGEERNLVGRNWSGKRGWEQRGE
jgi:hypothetical protein